MEEEIIDAVEQHKCAYDPCECLISSLETYCCEYCSDADSEKEVEVQCDCKHPACKLD